MTVSFTETNNGKLSNLSVSVPSIMVPHEPPYASFEPTIHGTWQPLKSQITIANAQINGGLFYFGKRLLNRKQDQNDACLIDDSLEIAAEESTADEPASWQEMSPGGRRAFVNWLANDRVSPNVINGVLLVYLYGLERRLLIDGPRENFSASEHLTLIREIRRLLSLYGDRPEFAKTARRILAMAWATYHDPRSMTEVPDLFDIFSPETSFAMPFYIACLICHDHPIEANLMYYWYIQHPDIRHDEYAESRKSFYYLFTQRMEQMFPSGYMAPKTSIPLEISYDACNPSLGKLIFEFPSLGNIFSNKIVYNLIDELGNQCKADLASYHAYLQGEESNAIGALLHLPTELRMNHPALKELCCYLSESTKNRVGCINVRDIFRKLALPEPVAITRQLADDIGKLLEMLCYQFAPNRRLHGTSFTIDDRIYLMPSLQSATLTQAFAVMSVILRLGAIVAMADTEVSACEVSILQGMILDQKDLTDDQRASLLLWLHWCLNAPQSVSDIRQDLSSLDQELRDQISLILVDIACADGVLDSREKSSLIMLHRALGLPEAWVDLALSDHSGINYKETKEELAIKDLPKVEEKYEAPEHGLDISRDLSNALANICENVPSEHMLQVFAEEQQEEKAVQIPMDEPHIRLLEVLIQKKSWPRIAVFEHALSFGLMADRAMEKLNQAAHFVIGNDVFHDGDDVVIDRDSAIRLYKTLSAQSATPIVI